MKSIASVAGIAALSLIGITGPVHADQQVEAGGFDVTYLKRTVQPIAEGHILLLSEATGTNKGAGTTVDGFDVSVREMADLDNGNGTHQGYVIFARNSDQQIVRVSGKVTTKIEDGQPKTTMAGTWEVVSATGGLAGTAGDGTYSGYFTAADRYHVDWQGARKPNQAKAAKR